MKLKKVKLKNGQVREVIKKSGNYLMVRPKAKVKGFDLINQTEVECYL